MHDVLLFLVGIVVGGMNAIAGGGMLIGFPILLAVGVPALVANVTTNIIVLPGSLSATYGYRRYLRRVRRQYLLLLLPTIIGAAIGATVLRHTSSTTFEQYVPGLILVAVVLFAAQPVLYSQLHHNLRGSKQLKSSKRVLLITGLIVVPLAAYGGYFGAGFGFIMLAFLGFTRLHDHIHRMNALKNIMTICIASTSLACLYSSHLIDWRHGLVMGSGCLLGGYFGSVLTQKIPSQAIRIIVIFIGLGTATYLGLRRY
jgi:uncharacterized membrane protein YfcA